jgi:Caspase domain/Domain of unknown function (DUF4384)
MTIQRIFFALFLFSSVLITRAQIPSNSNRSALFIGISTYENPEIQHLEGIPADLESAKKIALGMGIPPENITILKNQDATKKNIIQSLEQFSKSALDGGRTLIYYSGHGTRGFDPQTKRCYEGLLSYDSQVITQDEIAKAIQKLHQVIDKSFIMLDACYSGDLLNQPNSNMRSLTKKLTPKFFSTIAPSDTSICQQPSNYVTRSFLDKFLDKTTALGALQENTVFITAARSDEISYDEGPNRGGIATQAVRDCMLGSAQDLDASGGITINEIQTCAQEIINKKLPGPTFLPSHISIKGNRNLIPVINPVVSSSNLQDGNTNAVTNSSTSVNNVFETNSSITKIPEQPSLSSPFETITKPPVISNTIIASPNNPQVVPSKIDPSILTGVSSNPPPSTSMVRPFQEPIVSIVTFQDILAQSNPSRKVEINASPTHLKINKDYLNLKIKSSHDGYLYLILLGSDQKSFYVLYPNQLDKENFIRAGKTINLPKESWQIKATGPKGIDHILAIVSETPRNLNSLSFFGSDSNSPFVYSLNTLQGRNNLIRFLIQKNNSGSSDKFAAKIFSISESDE